jgi:hypothetical protein
MSNVNTLTASNLSPVVLVAINKIAMDEPLGHCYDEDRWNNEGMQCVYCGIHETENPDNMQLRYSVKHKDDCPWRIVREAVERMIKQEVDG